MIGGKNNVLLISLQNPAVDLFANPRPTSRCEPRSIVNPLCFRFGEEQLSPQRMPRELLPEQRP